MVELILRVKGTAMRLEKELFDKLMPDPEKLKAYGFTKEDDAFVFRKEIRNGEFRAEVTVKGADVYGSVIDLFSEEEYVAVHLSQHMGSYSSAVRKEYLKLLEDIAASCFERADFSSAQANRIASRVREKYGEVPLHIFDKFPDYAVLRHNNKDKWYALFLKDKDSDDRYELIDLKGDPSEIEELLKKDGIQPAYHMNRKSWYAAVTDDTMTDDMIMELLEKSRALTGGGKDRVSQEAWLIPANPSYFDVDHAFSVSPVLHWKQSASIQTGDLVYMYYGAPYSQIRYLCEVIETDIPFRGVNDGKVKFDKMMKIRMIRKYENDLIGRDVMKRCGVNAVRSARRMPVQLIEEIERIYDTEEKEHE